MKKLLALLLVAVMVLAVFPLAVAATPVPDELKEFYAFGEWPLAANTYDPAYDDLGLAAGTYICGNWTAAGATLPLPDSIAGYTKVDKPGDVGAGQYAFYESTSAYGTFTYFFVGGAPEAASEPEATEPDTQPAAPETDPDDDTAVPDTQPAAPPAASSVVIEEQTIASFSTYKLLDSRVESFSDKNGVVFVKIRDVIAVYNQALPLGIGIGVEAEGQVVEFTLGAADPQLDLEPKVGEDDATVTPSAWTYKFAGSEKVIGSYTFGGYNWIPADS
ncbi:MAG: hypothetical protein LBN97_08290, partial [Oscillospiraceae bacterium]|nr:hypothetical protein [Oscillospiraceae bacterium]